MNELLLLLAQNGVLLVLGATLLLSLGCGAVMLCKSPVHRQRISELTLAGVLGWMVLALVPLPRLLPDSFLGAKSKAGVVDFEPAHVLDIGRDHSSDSPSLIAKPLATPGIVLPSMERIAGESDLDESVPSAAFTGLMPEADGFGNPSYVPSPSEESPRAPPASSASTLWQFDSTKLAGLLAGAYLAGASLCVLWIFAGYALLLRIRQSEKAPPEWLVQQYRALARQAGIAPPRLIVSRLCARPLTWGVFWPVVVLPQSLCRQENKSQLETILLHELGHIAQQDAQGNLLFCAALPLLYAHPLYWWLRQESQLAAELVADDWAAQQTGKETYVEELVALARCTGTSSLPLVGVTGLFSSPSQFYRRMSMLLAREKPLSTKASLPWRLASLSALAGAVVLAASLAGVRPAVGQTEPPAEAPAADEPVVTPPAVTPPLAPAPVPLPATLAPPVALPPVGAPPGVTPPLAPAPVPLPATLAPPVALPPVGAPPGVTPPAVPATPAFRPAEIKDSPADADEAALMTEINQLRDKLRALEAKRGAKYYPIPKGAAAIRGGNKIAVTQADGEGKLWTEIWTTDEKGQPSKILSKTAVDGPVAKSGQLVFSPDGKILVQEVIDKDGSHRWYVLDGATGKVIEAVPAPAKGKPTADPRVTSPATDPNDPQKPDAPRTTAARRSELRFPTPVIPGKTAPRAYDHSVPVARPSEPSMAAGGQQLDLVKLATSYADAVSEVELAESRASDIDKLGDSNAISQREVRSAKLALDAAQRKEQLLRSIAQVATECAAQDFEQSSKLYKEGVTTGSAATEAKTRLEILKQILGTRPTKSEPKKQ